MENASTLGRPIRVGVFSTIRASDCAVEKLVQAGFTNERISVICSDRAIEEHFRQFEHEHTEAQRQRLELAERILSECGAEPVALNEG